MLAWILSERVERFGAYIRWHDWAHVRMPFVFLPILYLQYTDHVLGTGMVAYHTFFFVLASVWCYFAFLFVANDYFDFTQDRRSNKHRGLISQSGRRGVLLLTFVIGIIAVFVSTEKLKPIPMILTFIGYILAFFYSAPPLRFKEKGVWGIVVGSLVLRPVAMVVAISALLPVSRILDLLIFLLWAEIFSIRTMMFHQIDDYKNDLRASVKTYVTSLGIKPAQLLLYRYIIPVELAGLLVVGLRLVAEIPTVGFVIIMGTCAWGYHHLRMRTQDTFALSHYRPIAGSLILFYLPVSLAFFIGYRDGLWFITLFILLWLRVYATSPMHLLRVLRL